MHEGLNNGKNEISVVDGVCLKLLNPYDLYELETVANLDFDRLISEDHRLFKFADTKSHEAMAANRFGLYEPSPKTSYVLLDNREVAGEYAYELLSGANTAHIDFWASAEGGRRELLETRMAETIAASLLEDGFAALSARVRRENGVSRRALEQAGFRLSGPQSHQPDHFDLELTPQSFANRHSRANFQL